MPAISALGRQKIEGPLKIGEPSLCSETLSQNNVGGGSSVALEFPETLEGKTQGMRSREGSQG